MNKNKKIIILLINISLIALLFTLTSPGLKIDSTQNKGFIDNSIKSADSDGLTLTRAVISGPTVLDPVDCWEQAGNEVIRQVAEPLWYYNWTDMLMGRINMLAESQIFLNTTALSVNLRQGIKFHDNTPFDADAVKWNIDRLRYLFNHTGQLSSAERRGIPHSLYEDPSGNPLIAGFQVTGTYSGIIHLTHPFKTFMDLMCYTSSVIISPTSHTGDKHKFIDLATGDLVGTGPYKYDEYIAEQEVRFTRWDDYWGGPMPHEGFVAHFEKMVYAVIDDSSTRNYAMLAHEVDWLEEPVPDLFDMFREDPNIDFVELDNAGLGLSYLAFNNKQINVTWRKAMCYAFNYSYMVHDYWQDRVFRSYGWVSPGYGEWFTDEQITRGPYYNLTIARSIIVGVDPTEHPVPGIPEAAGLPINDDPWDPAWYAADLIEFNYSYDTTNQWRSDLYILLQDFFDKIGITVTDGGTDWDYFNLRAYGYVPGGYDDLQLFWVSWGPDYLDPINMIQPLLSNNSWHNSAQVNDPWVENAFMNYFAETSYGTKVELIHNISIYCITQLFSHMFGFHDKGTIVHSKDIYWDVKNEVNTYSFLRYDFYAYPLKSNCSLQILNSGDIEYLEGETGNSITWNLSADNLSDPFYIVYRNEEILIGDNWESGDSINVNVDGLYAGEYMYKIVVHNWGKSYDDYVKVTVIPHLQITHPSDISYLEGDVGYNIYWYVIKGSTENATYYIFSENNLIQSDTWEIGVPIVLSVDGLLEGNYSYSLEVHNNLEFREDTVNVKVFSSREDTVVGPKVPGFNLITLVSALIVVPFLIIKRKFKK